jgi:hypothetical protein
VSDFLGVRIGTHCPECMGPIPITRIAVRRLCHRCLSTIDLEWPRDLLARAWSPSPRKWPVGKQDSSANVTLAFKLDVQRVARAPEQASMRPADDLVTTVFPDAQRVYGEAADGEAQPTSEPLVFACMSCGGGLKVDGTSRVVACKFCNDSNFLPDALWLRMHPALKRRWLVVEY